MTKQELLVACFQNYDSLIISLKEEPTDKENKNILWWVEFNSGFKQSSKNFTVIESHEYKTGTITLKVKDTSKRTFYIHFSNRGHKKVGKQS